MRAIKDLSAIIFVNMLIVFLFGIFGDPIVAKGMFCNTIGFIGGYFAFRPDL